MTEGFQTAFAVAVGIATLGALLALLLFTRARTNIESLATATPAPCPGTALARGER
jgi:hypothetical protein